MSGDDKADRIRIDKWLWHARFYKTRSLAQDAAEAGRIRLNGARVVKSGHGVKLGDVLTVPQGRETFAVRGSPSAAPDLQPGPVAIQNRRRTGT